MPRVPTPATETGRKSTIANRQLLFRQNLLAMNVCHGRLGRRNEIQMPELGGIIAFGDAIVLILELGELPDAFEALGANHEWWGDFRITMFAGVQVEHVLNQPPLELGAPVGIEQEPAAR
jgi:hypothetical protein